MGIFATDPAATVSRAQEDQEQAEQAAEAMMAHATKISEAAYAIYSDAVACSWRIPRGGIEQLEQDMVTMVARLEGLRDGGA